MTELEIFEEHIKKTYPLAPLNKVYLNDDTYVSLQVDNMWKIWQASANREGYKLVPVEPDSGFIDKLADVICDEFSTTIEGSANCAKEAYKAMIGATP